MPESPPEPDLLEGFDMIRRKEDDPWEVYVEGVKGMKTRKELGGDQGSTGCLRLGRLLEEW